jgi:hypothetical protein
LLLDTDFKRIKTQSDVLRESVMQSTVSPLGLIAITAVGFLAGRRLFRKRRQAVHPTDVETETVATSSPKLWWLEILVPIAFTWLREAIITHIQRDREPPPPSSPQ